MTTVNRAKPANVYWIHLSQHTDIGTQGYVGVATANVQNRVRSHEWLAKRGSELPLHRAIRKYGIDSLVIDTFCQASAIECLAIERLLRPVRNIGWNVAIGGEAPMLGASLTDAHKAAVSRAQKGRLRTPQERQHISEQQRGRVATDEACLNMSAAAKRRVAMKGFSESHRVNISAAKKGVPTGAHPWEHNMADPDVWKQAPQLFEQWLSGQSVRSIESNHGWTNCKIASMVRMFKRGWVPTDDPQFLEWQR